MEIIEIISEQVLEFDGGETVLVLDADEVEILDVAEQGPAGIPGIPGIPGGYLLQYPAGEALGGHRMVVLDAAGQAIYAENTVSAHANKVLGMTTGAAVLGDLVAIQTGGEHSEPAWNWTLDMPIYLGTSGLLTQTPPTTGFSRIVGFPITATKAFFSNREPIFLN